MLSNLILLVIGVLFSAATIAVFIKWSDGNLKPEKISVRVKKNTQPEGYIK